MNARETGGGGGRVSVLFIATAVAGAFGYAIQALAGFGLSAAAYAGFSVFWAATFLVVGAVSGVQQEVARAVRSSPSSSSGHGRRLVAFALLAASTVGATVACSGLLWAAPVFGDGAAGSLALLTAAGMFSVGVAVLSGVMYGVSSWRRLALVIMLDPALRLIFIAVALLLAPDLIQWAIVLPIPVTLAAGVAVLVSAPRSAFVVDVGVRRLSGNAARTLLGASATAVLISALPLFIGAWARASDLSEVGALLFNLTVTRAPLVIPALAMQSLLILYFRDRRDRFVGPLLLFLGSIAAAALLLAALAGTIGAPLIGHLLGSQYELSGPLLAALVATAGLTAMLCVSGAAAIAFRGHTEFLVGWVLAAAVVVALIGLLPSGLGERTVIALTAGPALGLAVHAVPLVRLWRAGRSVSGKQDVPEQ